MTPFFNRHSGLEPESRVLESRVNEQSVRGELGEPQERTRPSPVRGEALSAQLLTLTVP